MEHAPFSPLDEDFSANPLDSTAITPDIRRSMEGTLGWARIMAFGNAGSAVLQLGGLILISPDIRRLLFYSYGYSSKLALIVISALLMVLCFTVILGWHQWRYAEHLKQALLFEDSHEMGLSVHALRRYFTMMGWATIGAAALLLLTIALFMYLKIV